MMAAAKIQNAVNIENVKESDVKALKDDVQVANFNPDNVQYIDDVKGNFPSGATAIEEIKPMHLKMQFILLIWVKSFIPGQLLQVLPSQEERIEAG
jgi:hypothetical protein